MKDTLRGMLRMVVAVAVCTAIVGCGNAEKRIKVRGKVVDGGKPLSLVGEEFKRGMKAVEVAFYPLDAAGKIDATKQSSGTTAGEDGSFTVDGDGKGIAPGKYKVALTYRDSTVRTRQGQGDRWEGKFNAEKTPFTVDVPSDKDVVLDIAGAEAPKPAAEKKP